MAKKVYLSKENFATLDTTDTVVIDVGGVSKTITKSTNDEYYVPLVAATTTEDGLMSSEDKTKLDTYRDITDTAYEKYTTESGSTLADFIKAFGYAIVGDIDEAGLFVATYEGDDTLIGLHNRGSGLAIIMGNDELYIYTNSTYSYANYASSATVTFEDTSTNIKMNGTQSLGSSGKVANSDHVHPSDTVKVDKVISSYTEETAPSGTELAFVDDGGTAKKITLSNLKTFVNPGVTLLNTFYNTSTSLGSLTSWAGGYTAISAYDYVLIVISNNSSDNASASQNGDAYMSVSQLLPISSFYAVKKDGEFEPPFHYWYGGVKLYIDVTADPEAENSTAISLSSCLLKRTSLYDMAYQLCGAPDAYHSITMKIYGIKY